jgi:hypothetical protein
MTARHPFTYLFTRPLAHPLPRLLPCSLFCATSLPCLAAPWRAGPRRHILLAVALALVVPGAGALAQPSCSSDGRPAPTAIVERFISADCETCWSDSPAIRTKPRELALDWIVPTARGDDAPMSPAASRDALQRLQSLHLPAPLGVFNQRHPGTITPQSLRVAQGVALGGYIGTSIELKPAHGAALPRQLLTVWLLLIEEIPAGTQGTPVARNLVRNALTLSWNKREQLSTVEQPTGGKRLLESRPMQIPNGANPDHLRVVGWVEDAKGRLIASAASVCVK